ncbi:coiled-coil domain-containing protein 15-like [Thalassophryne amazonica]|uniref:coiled-coil domain-containing protein 15-like n=1 Tax=Thalassophryne amazonica TaxID=390379 RepID=UPI0014721C63|nr:coiled-coil domain-containing protein 15-like [Thalassophryne amazonica]
MRSVRVKQQVVLGSRSQPVQALRVWVERGPDLQEDPFVLAQQSEQLLEIETRTKEEKLHCFQIEVRRRVAQHTQNSNNRRQLQTAQQKTPLRDLDQSPCGSSLCDSPLVWSVADQEEEKRQRQCHFVTQRRLFMDAEREKVKDEQRYREHMKSPGYRLKAEREQRRLQEERKLQPLPRPDDRELLILERIKREEKERAAQLERKKREDRKRAVKRFNEALRTEILERLSREKVDLPPLCLCTSSLWESHPDKCANNCMFYHNPQEYLRLLHSLMVNLEESRRKCR